MKPNPALDYLVDMDGPTGWVAGCDPRAVRVLSLFRVKDTRPHECMDRGDGKCWCGRVLHGLPAEKPHRGHDLLITLTFRDVDVIDDKGPYHGPPQSKIIVRGRVTHAIRVWKGEVTGNFEDWLQHKMRVLGLPVSDLLDVHVERAEHKPQWTYSPCGRFRRCICGAVEHGNFSQEN